MIQLRPHQTEILDRARSALPVHKSILIYSPPGSGKTVIAAAMASGAYQKRKRVIFCCHRREIMHQTSKTFDQFEIPHGFIAAGMSANPFASVQIASIDTLRNRFEKWPADLLVVDEAHLSGAKTWTSIVNHYRSKNAFIVGLSGSPCRMDGRPLRSNFSHMVEGPQNRWLMDRGFLSGYRAFAPMKMDVTGIHVRAGDYVTSELEEKFDRPSIIGDAVSSWLKFCRGRRTVVYAFSIDHSKHVAETFRAAGVRAAHIDGSTPKDERRAAIEAFADGRITVISSVDLLTTGFDLSAQVGRDVPIEAVSLLRPTKSLALAIQMMGRALRPKTDPAIILDHAGILRDHGLPDDDREWSLDGVTVNKSPGERAMSSVTCHECFGISRPAYRCPCILPDGTICGAIRQVTGREIEIVEGNLAELDIERMRQLAQADFDKRQKAEAHIRAKIEERECKTRDDWIRLAKKRGFKFGWALKMWDLKGRKAG